MKTFLSLLLYKRLFLANVLVPLFLGFLLMTVLGKSISSKMNNFDSTFSLGLINLDGDNKLVEKISKRKDIRLSEGITAANAQKKVSNGEIDLALILPEDFSEKINRKEKAEIKLYHRNNQLKIDDLRSSISSFEENIIINRMDSLNLSSVSINPVSIKYIDSSSNFIKKINESISNYTPLFFLFIGFIGFIIPCNIAFSKTKNKREIHSNPFWDKIIAVSIWPVLSVVFLLIGMWLSFLLTEGHPSFLKGAFNKYLSLTNCIHLIWILGISNFFWASLFAILNHKAGRTIGAFGISYFLFTIIFSFLVLISILFSNQETEGINLITLVPPINVWQAIKDLMIEKSINWANMLLYILSGLVWGAIAFLFAKKILKE